MCRSAIGMYQAILAQKAIPRAVAARALWQLGQCQEKLGQRREAHATYARVVRDFASRKQHRRAGARQTGWLERCAARSAQSSLRGGRPWKDAARAGSSRRWKRSAAVWPNCAARAAGDTGGCAVMIAPAIRRRARFRRKPDAELPRGGISRQDRAAARLGTRGGRRTGRSRPDVAARGPSQRQSGLPRGHGRPPGAFGRMDQLRDRGGDR